MQERLDQFCISSRVFNLIKEEKIKKIITTGPPHSTHLVGLRLKKYYDFNWWVDLRDPWTDIFYNTSLYRSKKTISRDEKLEKQVIQNANGVITSAGGIFIDKLKLKAPNQKFITLPNGYDSTLMKITKSLPKKWISLFTLDYLQKIKII